MRQRLLIDAVATLSICRRQILPSRLHPYASRFTTHSRTISHFAPRHQESQTSKTSLPPRPFTPQVSSKAQSPSSPIHRTLAAGLDDPLPEVSNDKEDWTRSYSGLSHEAFSAEASSTLMAEVNPDDIEIKPDGIVYLPEIKYRRILNRAFGPGGWGLAPRGETIVTSKLVTREYGLVCGGRLVSIARGEMQYFDPDGIPTATEGCKSNALMRCCKDLGVASELWDPRYIRRFLASHGKEVFVENTITKRRRKHWMRKDDEVRSPWKLVPALSSSARS